MATRDRKVILAEIDFLRTRLPLFHQRSLVSEGLAQAYLNMLRAGFLMLDMAVTELLEIEGIEPFPRAQDDEGAHDE